LKIIIKKIYQVRNRDPDGAEVRGTG